MNSGVTGSFLLGICWLGSVMISDIEGVTLGYLCVNKEASLTGRTLFQSMALVTTVPRLISVQLNEALEKRPLKGAGGICEEDPKISCADEMSEQLKQLHSRVTHEEPQRESHHCCEEEDAPHHHQASREGMGVFLEEAHQVWPHKATERTD